MADKKGKDLEGLGNDLEKTELVAFEIEEDEEEEKEWDFKRRGEKKEKESDVSDQKVSKICNTPATFESLCSFGVRESTTEAKLTQGIKMETLMGETNLGNNEEKKVDASEEVTPVSNDQSGGENMEPKKDKHERENKGFIQQQDELIEKRQLKLMTIDREKDAVTSRKLGLELYKRHGIGFRNVSLKTADIQVLKKQAESSNSAKRKRDADRHSKEGSALAVSTKAPEVIQLDSSDDDDKDFKPVRLRQRKRDSKGNIVPIQGPGSSRSLTVVDEEEKAAVGKIEPRSVSVHSTPNIITRHGVKVIMSSSSDDETKESKVDERKSKVKGKGNKSKKVEPIQTRNVESEKNTMSKPKIKLNSEVESTAKTKSDVKPASKSKSSEVKQTFQTKSEVKRDLKTKSEMESTTETKPNVKAAPKTKSEMKSAAETKSELKLTPETKPEMESNPAIKSVGKPESGTEPKQLAKTVASSSGNMNHDTSAEAQEPVPGPSGTTWKPEMIKNPSLSISRKKGEATSDIMKKSCALYVMDTSSSSDEDEENKEEKYNRKKQ